MIGEGGTEEAEYDSCVGVQECQDAARVGHRLPEHSTQRPAERSGVAQQARHPPGSMQVDCQEDATVRPLFLKSYKDSAVSGDRTPRDSSKVLYAEHLECLRKGG